MLSVLILLASIVTVKSQCEGKSLPYNAVTKGYNIFMADPIYFGNQNDDGVLQDIFAGTCETGKTTPIGMKLNSKFICSSDENANTATGMSSYKNELSGSLSISGGANTAGYEGSFSASTSYKSVEEILSSQNNVLITATSWCTTGQVTLTPGKVSDGGAPLHNLFINALKELERTEEMNLDAMNSDAGMEKVRKYYSFMTNYGTHYNVNVGFGHKYGKRYQMDSSDFETMKSEGIDAELEAQVSNMVANGEVRSSVSASKEETQKFNNAVKNTQFLLIATSLPDKSESAVDQWLGDINKYVSGHAAEPLDRILQPISELMTSAKIQLGQAGVDNLYLLKRNLEWALTNYCKIAVRLGATIDCKPLKPDASVYKHAVREMQWTTGEQDGLNYHGSQLCMNYELGNHVTKVVALRQRGYGVVEFKIVCDWGDSHTFTGNRRGWEEKWLPVPGSYVSNGRLTGIQTWRQRGYGIVNIGLLTSKGATEWSNGITQSTQKGKSECVLGEVLVGLEVKQMTSRGVVNVRALCYDVGKECSFQSGSACIIPVGVKQAEFLYGYQNEYANWVDLPVSDNVPVACDPVTMGASVGIGANKKCRWREHPDTQYLLPGKKCADYWGSCTCYGQVRMNGVSYVTDWVDKQGTVACNENQNLGIFPDLDFDRWNSEKTCECRSGVSYSKKAEVEVAQIGSPHVKSENAFNTESVLVLAPGSLTTRMLALVGMFGILKILYGSCRPDKEYAVVADTQNEI